MCVLPGEAVYATKCASCHQTGGVGIDGVFPPLAGNDRVADAAYVEDTIRNGRSGPLDVAGVTYDTEMVAVALSDQEIADVVAYVQTLAGGVAPPPTAAPEPATGDATNGEKLYSGSKSFTNGGAACIACHAAGSGVFAGGSGFAPDLTDVYDRFGGEAGLNAWLASPASYPGAMGPVFEGKELTEDEIADLTAYLGSVSAEDPRGALDVVLFAALGGAGLLVLLGLMYLLIKGPNRTYNERLRSGQ